MANGEQQILVITEQRLLQIVSTAVTAALAELDMATAVQLRRQLEKTRYRLADAETAARTQREVAALRAEKVTQLELERDRLKEEKYRLEARVAMMQSVIKNLENEAALAGPNAGERKP
jgi:alanine dehydrogenase